jgi:hypothetical protein
VLSSLAQTITEPPFWDRLVVAAVGPLVTAVVGTGVIGWVILRVADSTQARRAEETLRRELLSNAMNAAGSLYFALQSYRRAERDNDLSKQAKGEQRRELEHQYFDTKVQAGLLEGEIDALFGEVLATEWHRTSDLLTVRYMQLTGNVTAHLYESNARHYDGKEHSGLTIEELKDRDGVGRAYRNALRNVAGGIMTAKFQRPDR